MVVNKPCKLSGALEAFVRIFARGLWLFYPQVYGNCLQQRLSRDFDDNI